MFENVEFTSRYGPHVPSWLRTCHGKCEGMGLYPVYHAASDRRVGAHIVRLADPPKLSDLELDHILARIVEGAMQYDGWYFLVCPSCGGSGRVSWLRTIARVPRWLWKGIGTMREFRPSSPVHVPEWSTRRRIWIAFKVAFLADLGVRM